jgi:hypothetical protein
MSHGRTAARDFIAQGNGLIVGYDVQFLAQQILASFILLKGGFETFLIGQGTHERLVYPFMQRIDEQ